MTERKNSSKKKVEPKELLWIEEGYTPMESIRTTNEKPDQYVRKTEPVNSKSSDDEK